MSLPLASRPLSIALALAFGTLPALAAEQAVETLLVTGARTPTKITDLPRTAWVITGEELAEQVGAGVPFKEILGQLVPSLDAGPQGRTNYGQNLRGRGVQVMIDGVSLNSSRGVSRQFDSIDPYNIERIEVLAGASAVYGGGATGGVVNIVTKRGQKGGAQFNSEVGLRSGFQSGEDLDWRAAQSISAGNDTVSGRLAAAWQGTGAAYDAHGKQVTPDITQTDLQYNRSVDVLGNLDFRLAAGQRLNLSAQYYDSGFDGSKALYLGPNLSGALAGGNPALLEVRDGFQSDVTPSTRRATGSFDYFRPQVIGGQDFYLQGSVRTEKLDFYPFPGTASGTAQNANNTTTAVRVPYYSTSRQNTRAHAFKAVLAKDFGAVKLNYGVDIDNEVFEANQVLFNTAQGYASGGLVLRQTAEVGRYPGFEVDGRSLFAEADWKLNEAWSLRAGLRNQWMDVAVGDFVASTQQVMLANGRGRTADAIKGGQNDYTVSLFNLGTVWRISDASQAWLNYSEGFELPDPAKYYGQGSYRLVGGNTGHWTLLNGISVASQPLAGIKTRQVESGWRSRSGGLSGQAAAFYSWSDKAIQYVSSTLAINVIEQDVRNYGLEGELSYRFADDWQLGGNLLAIKSENKVGGEWKKQTVTSASPSKLTAYGSWQNGALSLRLQAVRSFALSDSDGKRLDDYTVADLLGSYALTRGKLSFGVQNLFDRQYDTIWGQRAKLFYSSLVAPATVDFKGRGRTVGLAYSVDY
jgi:iron complex outermembrane receptor protein